MQKKSVLIEKNQLWNKSVLVAKVQMVTSCSYLVYLLLIMDNFMNLSSRHEQAQFGKRDEMGKYKYDQEILKCFNCCQKTNNNERSMSA